MRPLLTICDGGHTLYLLHVNFNLRPPALLDVLDILLRLTKPRNRGGDDAENRLEDVMPTPEDAADSGLDDSSNASSSEISAAVSTSSSTSSSSGGGGGGGHKSSK